jgi:hypothetical protein
VFNKNQQNWRSILFFVSLIVAALVAPICAVVELFSSRGMDTLTVPLSAAFAILPLMLFFAYLGM